jgi:hypothetical protein
LSRRAARLFLAGLLAAQASRAAGVIGPEGGGCAESTPTIVVDSFSIAHGVIDLKGHYALSGPATGVMIEYSIENNTYRQELRMGKEGEYAIQFPFRFCGDNVFRAWAYPLVPDGARLSICLQRKISARHLFNAPCGADIEVSDLRWACADDGACNGEVSVNVGGGASDADLMLSVGQAAFSQAVPRGRPPFELKLTCHAGEKLRLRARNGDSSSYTGAVSLTCGKP